MKKPQQVDMMNHVKQQQEQEQQQFPESIDPRKLALGKVIDNGYFSVVYKGTYGRQTVAVTFYDSASKENRMEFMKTYFMNEVTLWHNLDHPNISKMIGATLSIKANTALKNKTCQTTSDFCIVSEYLKGGSLRAYLAETRYNKVKPCKKIIIRMALDIASGLSYLHSKKIIHLDVKPDNLLIGKQQTIKLANFGQSAVFEDKLSLLCGDLIGTLGYMAPEVFIRREYGRKCDVFSFGIVLWELYCCEFAYSKANLDYGIDADLYLIIRPRIPRNCPRSLAQLMEQCWETDPGKRPEMASVVASLEEIAKSEGCQTISQDKKGVANCFGFFKHGR